MTRTPAALAALLLAAAGCTPPAAARDTPHPGHTTPAPAHAQRAYLEQLHTTAGDHPRRDLRPLGDRATVDIGHAVCQDLDTGWSPGEIIADLAELPDPVGPMAAPLVRAAAHHLCP